ncbi:YlbF family regulator [Halorussus salilacus]|uniref:YlbF family regulator n=1 Tax=Halorussus salilacus TaxID=2953750 RepID=UPI0020A039C7|nr:YlbF family regulator [Halorussus salilacus]USZ68437.1 YlbF family regulator [Halorussus salilacus]
MSVDTEADADETADLSHVEALGAELGEAIAETPVYQRFEETKAAVEEDEQAQEKVKEFEQLRQEFMLARQTGEATQEDVQKVQRAQNELHSLPVMEEYLDAQEELEAKLEAVNDAISEPLAVDFGQQGGGCCED